MKRKLVSKYSQRDFSKLVAQGVHATIPLYRSHRQKLLLYVFLSEALGVISASSEFHSRLGNSEPFWFANVAFDFRDESFLRKVEPLEIHQDCRVECFAIFVTHKIYHNHRALQ